MGTMAFCRDGRTPCRLRRGWQEHGGAAYRRRLFRGGTLPDGQGAPLLDTLIFAAEDSPEHTIIPRLMKMGADLDRIRIVDGIAREGSEPGWIQLRNHVTAIEQAVLEHDIGLVIIDPVSSFIGDATETRSLMYVRGSCRSWPWPSERAPPS